MSSNTGLWPREKPCPTESRAELPGGRRVIVADLGWVSDRFAVRVHIALTRALDAVRVVGVKFNAI